MTAPVTLVETTAAPARPTGLRRALVAGGWLAIVAAYAGQATTVAAANRAWLIHHLPDDAFYYLEVARRISRGQGATFDGLHHTNGFHPLWQGMLAVAASVVGGGDALIRAALFANLALSLGAVVLVYRLLRKVAGDLPAVGALLVAVRSPSNMHSWVNGMESAAVLFTLALVLTALARALRDPGGRSALLLGAACGLAVLARVDLATVIWIVPAVVFWRQRRLDVALVWLAGAAAVLAPWVIWSLVWAGHVLPVSGTLKLWAINQLPNRYGGRFTTGYAGFVWHTASQYVRDIIGGADAGNVGGPGVLGTVLAHLLTILALLGLVRARPRMRATVAGWPAETVALLAGSAVVAGKALVDVVTLPFWAEAWYSAPARLATGIVLALGAFRFLRWAGREAPALGAVALCGVVATLSPINVGELMRAGSDTVHPSWWQDANLQVASWIVQDGPSGVYGSTDSGLVGYYVDGKAAAVNLDGLVNDYRYASMLMHQVPALPRYRAEGVRYLFGRLPSGSDAIPACSRLMWTSPAGVLYGGSLDAPQVTSVPISVYDLTGCK